MELQHESDSESESTTLKQGNMDSGTLITEIESHEETSSSTQPSSSSSFITEIVEHIGKDQNMDGPMKSMFKIESMNSTVSFTSAVKTTVREIRTTETRSGEKIVSISEDKVTSTKSGFGENFFDLKDGEKSFSQTSSSEFYTVNANGDRSPQQQLGANAKVKEIKDKIENLVGESEVQAQAQAVVEEPMTLRQRHLDETHASAPAAATNDVPETKMDEKNEVKSNSNAVDYKFLARFVGFFCMFMIIFWIFD